MIDLDTPIRKVDPDDRAITVRPVSPSEPVAELPVEIPVPDVSTHWWDRLALTVARYWTILTALPDFLRLRLVAEAFFKSIKDGQMSDPKTTVTTIVTMIVALLAHFAVQVPTEVVTGIIAVGTVIAALLAKQNIHNFLLAGIGGVVSIVMYYLKLDAGLYTLIMGFVVTILGWLGIDSTPTPAPAK